jgi:hypothetical protein
MYCENCLQEDLDYWVSDNIGSCFCSEKCLKEFEKIKIINRW